MDTIIDPHVIQSFVDDLLDSLDPSDFHEAINWGDLNCTEAQITGEGVRVYIQECDPDSPELFAVIGDAVGEKYGLQAVVIGEW